MTWCSEREEIETERLLLRPFKAADAAAIQGYVSRWDIARMTTRIPHPYPAGAAAAWIDTHQKERALGLEYIFAIALKPEPGPELDPAIGATSLRKRQPGSFELGYWLAPGYWGSGLATEAAQAMVTYGFEKLNAGDLQSGHFIDNPASGRVLAKCGFRPRDEDQREWSVARQDFVTCKRCVLDRTVWQQLDLAS